MSSLTMEKLRADIARMRSDMARLTPGPDGCDGFSGLRIVESPMCVRDSDKPRRLHKQRRWMSDAYHLRIQKKWAKRWGYAPEYFAIQSNPRALGLLGEPTLFVHPVIAQQMRYEAAARARHEALCDPMLAFQRAALFGNGSLL